MVGEFGGVPAPPRARALGDTTRLIALLGLLAQAAAVVVTLLLQLVFEVWGTRAASEPSLAALDPSTGQGWYGAAVLVLSLVWVPAYLALVENRRRTAFVLTGLALLPSLLRFAEPAVGLGRPALLVSAVLTSSVIWVPALCMLLGFHRDAPPVRTHVWRRAFPVAVLAYGALVAGSYGSAAALWPGADALAVFVGAVVVLAARHRVGRPWAAAVAVLAALVVFGYLVTLPALFSADLGVSPVRPIILSAALALAGFAAAVVASRLGHPTRAPLARGHGSS